MIGSGFLKLLQFLSMDQTLGIQSVDALHSFFGGNIKLLHLSNKVRVNRIFDGLCGIIKKLRELFVSADLRLVNSHSHVFSQPEKFLSRCGLSTLNHIIHLVLEGPYGIFEFTLCVCKSSCVVLLHSCNKFLDLLTKSVDDGLVIVFNGF
jgi:hypothetical protein